MRGTSMSSYQLIQVAPLLILLAVAAVIDMRSRRIPNWLNGALIAIGLLRCAMPQHALSIWEAFAGLGTGLALMLVLYALGAVGAGDVKLMAAVGTWVGPTATVQIFVVEAVVGLVIVLIQSLRQGRLTVLFRNSAVLTIN